MTMISKHLTPGEGYRCSEVAQRPVQLLTDGGSEVAAVRVSGKEGEVAIIAVEKGVGVSCERGEA
jgi:hypothetical protein